LIRKYLKYQSINRRIWCPGEDSNLHASRR
jgi:hypothetical protein